MRGIIADLFGNGPVLRVIPLASYGGDLTCRDRDRRRLSPRLRHVAGCDYLTTTDDRMLGFKDRRMKAMAPADMACLRAA